MSERQLIPQGKYLAKATAAVMGRSGTGKEQIAIQFEILAPESLQGRTLTYYGYFTENTTERTLDSLEYCGWDGAGFGAESLATVTTNEVQIVVAHEPDDKGVMRDRIQWINKPNSGPVVKEELDARGVAGLEARLKGELMKRRGNAKQRQPQGQQRKPPVGRAPADDDFGPVDYDPGF